MQSAECVILHAGALGDLILTIQLALRRPSALMGEPLERLIVVSRTSLGGLEAARPAIAHVSPDSADTHWLYLDDQTPPPRLRSLIAGRCVLNALGESGGSVHRRLLRLGPRSLHSFDTRLTPDESNGLCHVLDVWSGRLGVDSPKSAPAVIAAPPERVLIGRQLLAQAGLAAPGSRFTSTVLIHPGSGGRHKCWPLERFMALASALHERGMQAGWVIGAVEREVRPDLETALRNEPLIRSATSETLVSCLAAAQAFVGNDSGPGHLAAMLGCRTLGLFGPTRGAVWGPVGRAVSIVQGPAPQEHDWGISPAEVAARLTEQSW